MTNCREKINQVIRNEEFVKQLESMESVDEVKKLFASNNVELTDDELNEFFGSPLEESKGDELNETDLDNVAGGIGLTAVMATWGFACQYWGGPRKAMLETVKFWTGLFK